MCICWSFVNVNNILEISFLAVRPSDSEEGFYFIAAEKCKKDILLHEIRNLYSHDSVCRYIFCDNGEHRMSR